jgi:hypothetical protein
MFNSPNTQPIFIRTPTIHSIVLQSQIGDRVPSSTLVPPTFIVGADPATAIETIEVQPTGLMVATTLNLYLWSAVGTQGQNRLILSTALPAITAIDTASPIVLRLPRTNSPASPDPSVPNQMLRIPNGWELRTALSEAIATPVIVTAFGGSYY